MYQKIQDKTLVIVDFKINYKTSQSESEVQKLIIILLVQHTVIILYVGLAESVYTQRPSEALFLLPSLPHLSFPSLNLEHMLRRSPENPLDDLCGNSLSASTKFARMCIPLYCRS